jgi:hypothetical protein
MDTYATTSVLARYAYPFSGPEYARLAVYRRAVADGFYTDAMPEMPQATDLIAVCDSAETELLRQDTLAMLVASAATTEEQQQLRKRLEFCRWQVQRGYFSDFPQSCADEPSVTRIADVGGE